MMSDKDLFHSTHNESMPELAFDSLKQLSIKSVRADYNDVNPFYAEAVNNTLTKTEWRKITFGSVHKSISIPELSCKITKIEMHGLPPAKYTLCANGFNLCSDAKCFDIVEKAKAQAQNSALNTLCQHMYERCKIEQEQRGPCMCGECGVCNTYSVPEDIFLDRFQAVDLKICAPKTVKLPDIVTLHITGYYKNSYVETQVVEVYTNSYDLALQHPTDYISFNPKITGSEPEIIISYGMNNLIIPVTTSELVVIKFSDSLRSFLGVQDFHLEHAALETLNFSRVPTYRIAFRDVHMDEMCQCYYMTYFMPHKNVLTPSKKYTHTTVDILH